MEHGETPGGDEAALRERISAAYAPLVALYRLLEGRRTEDGPGGGAASGPGWRPCLDAVLALRSGEVAGGRADLALLMVDPAELPPGPARLVEGDAGAAGEELRRLAAGGGRTLLLTGTAEAARAVLATLTGSGVYAQLLTPAGGRAAGDAYRRDWLEESRGLQRTLLWLEQWPRDRESLELLAAEHRDARAAGEAALERMTLALGGCREDVAAATEALAVAGRERDRLGAALAEAEAAAGAAGSVFEEVRGRAERAAAEAAEAAATARESQARLAAIEERIAAAGQERDHARAREEYLLEELPKARAALPEAADEAGRAAERLAAAEADGHASYYRLAAAESALTAGKKRLTLTQKLRVSPAPKETQDLRRTVSSRRREAEDAARGARGAREDHDRAETYRDAISKVIADGDRELIATREAQSRLGEELETLAADRVPATERHTADAGQAAQAAGRAQAAEGAAREAYAAMTAAQQARDRSRAEHERGSAAADTATAGLRAAEGRVTAAEAALEQATAAAAEAEHDRAAERALAEEAAESARARLADALGEDPATAGPGVLDAARDRAMARIEELSAVLADDLPPAPPPATAQVVAATPAELATAPFDHPPYDTLVAFDAAALTTGEFLAGAVHTPGWVLVGTPGTTPPPLPAEYAVHLKALAVLARGEEEPAEEPVAEEPPPAPPAPPEPVPGDPPSIRSTGNTVAFAAFPQTPPPPPQPQPDGDRTRVDVPVQGCDRTVVDVRGSGVTNPDLVIDPVAIEVARIRGEELWEGHYAEAYAKATGRLSEYGDPAEVLREAVAGLLERSVFALIAEAAPGLLGGGAG